jgi:hypothetical protein
MSEQPDGVLMADGPELQAHIKNGGAISTPVFFLSHEFITEAHGS